MKLFHQSYSVATDMIREVIHGTLYEFTRSKHNRVVDAICDEIIHKHGTRALDYIEDFQEERFGYVFEKAGEYEEKIEKTGMEELNNNGFPVSSSKYGEELFLNMMADYYGLNLRKIVEASPGHCDCIRVREGEEMRDIKTPLDLKMLDSRMDEMQMLIGFQIDSICDLEQNYGKAELNLEGVLYGLKGVLRLLYDKVDTCQKHVEGIERMVAKIHKYGSLEHIPPDESSSDATSN